MRQLGQSNFFFSHKNSLQIKAVTNVTTVTTKKVKTYTTLLRAISLRGKSSVYRVTKPVVTLVTLVTRLISLTFISHALVTEPVTLVTPKPPNARPPAAGTALRA